MKNKKIVKTSNIEVVEIIIEKNDRPELMPNRIVKEYWTIQGEFIGRIDPLDKYPEIVNSTKYKYIK